MRGLQTSSFYQLLRYWVSEGHVDWIIPLNSAFTSEYDVFIFMRIKSPTVIFETYSAL